MTWIFKEEFFKFLVSKFPPCEDFDINIEDNIRDTGMKTTVRNLIKRYHPDKFSNRKNVMQEICKFLTAIYENLK